MVKRGRRSREVGDRDQEAARDAGRQRVVYRVGGSWVVAVPTWARRALSVVEGGALYWHDGGAGVVMLSDSPARPTGHRAATTLQRELDQARRENAKLRQQVQARPLKLAHQAENVGWMKAAKYYTRLDGDMQAILDQQRQIVDLLSTPPGRRWRGYKRPSPSASAPSSEVAAGEAVTPGMQSPGDPQVIHEAEHVPG